LRRVCLLLITAAFVLGVSGEALAAMVSLEPASPGQGQPALIKACLGKMVRAARVRFLKRETPLNRGKDGCFYGVTAPDIQTNPGSYKLVVFADNKPTASAKVRVRAKNYGERRITVAKKFMRLTPQQLSRHKREIKAQKKVYQLTMPTRYWRGAFIKPVPGSISGTFGRRSVINGQPRSPHGGVDLRGAKGTPVKASGAGRVALVQDSFFGGQVVLINHGQGLVTAYRHLDSIKVKNGQMVAKGQVIGLVGMTGRVTGPHLHFDIHLGGARVDPMAWLRISRVFSKRLAGK
jgi:murein DD-endopeptidase MepM/ murein hydrolase activator NlpD